MEPLQIILTVICVAISAGLSMFLAYLGMNRKLEKILRREYMGILSREQSTALLKLYLEEIKRELNREIDDYCDNKLNNVTSDNDPKIVSIRLHNALETRYIRVREMVSNKFSRFTVAHGKNFMDFISNIDRTALPVTKEGVINTVAIHIKTYGCSESCDVQALKEVLSAQMVQANAHGRVVFENALNEWYESN